MERTHSLERAVYGDPSINRPGIVERLNTTEQIATGIQSRLNQLAFGVIGLVVTAVMQLVLAKHTSIKIDQLPPSPPKTATP
jgi:hypothetical protein